MAALILTPLPLPISGKGKGADPLRPRDLVDPNCKPTALVRLPSVHENGAADNGAGDHIHHTRRAVST